MKYLRPQIRKHDIPFYNRRSLFCNKDFESLIRSKKILMKILILQFKISLKTNFLTICSMERDKKKVSYPLRIWDTYCRVKS